MLLRNLFIGTCLVTVTGLQAFAQQADFPIVAEDDAFLAPASPALPSDAIAVQELTGRFPGLAIVGHARNPADRDLVKAMQKYKQSESDSDARDEAKEEIQKALGEQYDAYLKDQEKHLEAMEKKLADLKDQLKQRGAAKGKMVDLKFEMVLAELDGLGWPETSDGWIGGANHSNLFRSRVDAMNLMTTDPEPAAASPDSTKSTGRGSSRSVPSRSRGGQ